MNENILTRIYKSFLNRFFPSLPSQFHSLSIRSLTRKKMSPSTVNTATLINGNGSVVKVAEHCQQGALTTKFGLFIQALLALLAFSFLILKRLKEPRDERRPWLVWFFDTSKQALGALLIHFANVFLSDAFKGDPCTWYIIYFLLDSTLGLLLIYVGVKLVTTIINLLDFNSLRFGEYGNPPQWDSWIGQCAIYILLMIVEKVVITLFASLPIWRKVAQVLLLPIHNAKVEVALVMLIIPFILNAVMFWVVDNFLMRKRKKMKVHHDQTATVLYHRSHQGQRNAQELEILLSVDEDDASSVEMNGRHEPISL